MLIEYYALQHNLKLVVAQDCEKHARSARERGALRYLKSYRSETWKLLKTNGPDGYAPSNIARRQTGLRRDAG